MDTTINKVTNFWRPELLASPNIPKPLHTVNPRTILGKKWWDSVRQIAYKKHDYKCYACGTPKQNASYHQWLEAHEDYNIDWETGKVELREIVALCHSCHNFIHNSRLYTIYLNGEIGRDKFEDILEHGFDICKRNNIKPYYGAFKVKYLMMGYPEILAEQFARVDGWFPQKSADWDKWHLIIEGQSYYSPFKDLNEWQKYWK